MENRGQGSHEEMVNICARGRTKKKDGSATP